jgi:hypothetical protein
MTAGQQQAIAKFLGIFPNGFADTDYIGDLQKGERYYKCAAHEAWEAALGRQECVRLTVSGEFTEVTARALRVEARTNLLSTFEKSALRDAVKEPADATEFGSGLVDLIYGKDALQFRFTRFVNVLARLPRPKSSAFKWPVATLFPFLANPETYLFLKPEVTKKAAEVWDFSLDYQPYPNWTTYSRLLEFGRVLMHGLVHLKPRDMIDIQSFIYVTGVDSYSADLELDDAAVGALERNNARGQGFLLDSKLRKALEDHAMEAATRHFESLGYKVENCSKNHPYDLLCRRDEEVLYVEVKGTQTDGSGIVLTVGEVEFARSHKGQMALFVLHSIQVSEGEGGFVLGDGERNVIVPWDVDVGTLRPLAFKYEVPA